MHDIRRSCQSSLSYFSFRHWHFKCTLISASVQPSWSWLRALLLKSSNFIVVKSSSTGAGGSDYCKWACSLFSNSGFFIVLTLFIKLYSVHVACVLTNPRVVSCLGLVSLRSSYSMSLSSVFKLWDVRLLFKISVYFAPIWNITDIHEQMQEWWASAEW